MVAVLRVILDANDISYENDAGDECDANIRSRNVWCTVDDDDGNSNNGRYEAL